MLELSCFPPTLSPPVITALYSLGSSDSQRSPLPHTHMAFPELDSQGLVEDSSGNGGGGGGKGGDLHSVLPPAPMLRPLSISFTLLSEGPGSSKACPHWPASLRLPGGVRVMLWEEPGLWGQTEAF